MGYRIKKPHRLALSSMSKLYQEERAADFEKAKNYAQGRVTSMGFGSLQATMATIEKKRPTTLGGQLLMMTGVFLKRMFSHRKM